MPGVIPLRRSDLIPALDSRAESSPRSLPGATWKASRTPAGRSPCSSTIASCPGLLAGIARPFSLATMLKPTTRVKYSSWRSRSGVVSVACPIRLTCSIATLLVQQWSMSGATSRRDQQVSGKTQSTALQLHLPARPVSAHRHGHLADRVDAREHGVARLDRADPFRRSGIEHVAGIEGVEGRAPFDQLAAIVDQLLGTAVLLELAVDGNLKRHVVRIGNFVGGHQPRPEHGIGVDRFAKAPVLGTARGHVQPDGVSDHVIERLLARDIAALLAEDDRKLDLVLVAALGEADRHALGRADQRRVRLQEKPGRADGWRRLDA